MGDPRADARGFVERLRKAAGDRLQSVVLHGSVARGEAVSGVSDVNLLVLFDDVEPELLRRLAPEARRWLDEERSLPLVLSSDEWRAASDVFPIETADMLDAREVLAGDDPLAGASVRPTELRLQAERELRGKLIQLREGTLAAADRPKELGRLLVRVMPSVATYFRAVIRLAGEPAPRQTPEAIDRGCVLVGLEPAPLRELWSIRGSGREPKTDVSDRLATAVHRALERTVEYVDTHSGENETP